jgi:hypothetical protein
MNGQSRTRRRAGGKPGLSYISTFIYRPFLTRGSEHDIVFTYAKPVSDINLTFLCGATDLIDWNLLCDGKSGTNSDFRSGSLPARSSS